ncbi:MAG TPA: DUF4160 domain-containing protein [Pirellulales bacterium]
MPEISRFFGIAIKVYYRDHAPPHFHAEYGGDEAMIGIDSLAVLAGKLSSRAMGLVLEWAALHQAELRKVWVQARNFEPLDRIDPLL